MNQSEQWKLIGKVMLPYFALMWVYMRFVPQPPVLVDLLVFPGSMLLYFLILRQNRFFRRFQNPDDERFQVRGINAIRSIMCYTMMPLFMRSRHEGGIPEQVLTWIMAVGLVGLFVSFPFVIAHSAMEFVAWRRKRRARAAGTG